MKKYLEVALGIFTSIGGFLEVGAIATTAQAGAQFGFRLAWVLLLGTICVIFLVEMSGRLSAVSKHTLQDAMRERFGAGFFLVSTIPGMVVDWLVLASEIGGVALGLQLVTGISYQWWAFPVAIAAWLLLFIASVRELGASILLMGPKAKVITPAIVESWFSTSTELTAAMALLQTLAVAVALVLMFSVARRAMQAPGE